MVSMPDTTNDYESRSDAFDTPHNHLPDVTQSEYSVPAEIPQTTKPEVKNSFAGGTWFALIVGALLLIVLLIFILQNQQAVELNFFTLQFTVPAGVGFLLAAIFGALIMAMVGVVRMFQLRRQIKNLQRSI
ncbi:lipopolysaccharide assembly LapA domain-containing protein [Corynebacterium diphtheriae]|uniref:LapA family protein n=1 Tax=Corynebacterium diphtheriae TaxID=1717 RepID=UPI0035306126